jgi:pre-mRNA-splicing helicase BRR2
MVCAVVAGVVLLMMLLPCVCCSSSGWDLWGNLPSVAYELYLMAEACSACAHTRLVRQAALPPRQYPPALPPALLTAPLLRHRYPDITLTHEVAGGSEVPAGGSVTLHVQLQREAEGEPGPALCPRFPGRKEESWWLVVGEPGSNQLLAIKRVTLGLAAKAKLDFAAPAELGSKQLQLTFMCDSYMGCDQEYEFELQVVEGQEGSSDEEMSDAE